jgi:hypothetical protein
MDVMGHIYPIEITKFLRYSVHVDPVQSSCIFVRDL